MRGKEMAVYIMKFVCLLIFYCDMVIAQGGDGKDADDRYIKVMIPPSIIEQSNYENDFKSFKPGSSFPLKCIAGGKPVPKCKWVVNGEKLNLVAHGDRLSQNNQDGTLNFIKAISAEDGYYQCRCKNDHGTSTSRVVFVQQATSSIGQGRTVIREVTEGEKLEIRCDQATCTPPSEAVFTWTIAKGIDEGGTELDISEDPRVYVTDDGAILFAYTKKSDEHGGDIYKCNLRNKLTDVSIGGSYLTLVVKQDNPIGEAKPETIYKDYSPKILYRPGSFVALEGNNIKLKCFFSGKPAPTVNWGGPLPTGRYKFINTISRHNLELIKVTKEDEGDYTCQGTNSAGSSVMETLSLKVESVPKFTPDGRPKAQNITEAETAEFTCKTAAVPVAKVQWYKNGEALDPDNLPKRYSIDGNKLSIAKVTKPDDLMNIQCNVSNIHGYVFADGYLNVLLKTEFLVLPEDVAVTVNTSSTLFNVSARTDASTDLKFTWRHKGDSSRGKREADFEEIQYKQGVIEKMDNGSLFINFTGMAMDERAKYQGQYQVEATNIYSTQTAPIITLTLENAPTPAPAIAAAGGFDLWWIFIIVAILLLLLLLLLCCCLWCQRNRGDDYPVDEKERANGNDPEKELADDGYHDYTRPEDEPVKGSRASLNSSIKLDSDDEGSLNEYGDIDTGKFNEDGSFIGLYGTDKKKKDAAPPPYTPSKPSDTTV